MGELIQKAETAIAENPQMPRYRALETMDKQKYNPVAELIEIARELKAQDLRSYELEMKVHLKLLEYFSPSQKKQLDVNVQGGGTQIVVVPYTTQHLYEGKDLSPCKPQLIDVIPQTTVLEEFMGATEPSYSDTESQ